MFRLTLRKLLIYYTLLFFVYAIWTYFLTDRNLVLLSTPLYWNWQVWMWGVGKEVVAGLYVGLVLLISLIYVLLLKARNLNFEIRKFFFIVLIPLSLIFSYNALSHDVFNYIFNARMVLMYGADPHVQVALDFSSDPWIRFMHNVHTPAPYWYGWTFFSLPMYFVGFGKFIITWLSFKFSSGLGFLFLLFSVKKLLKKVKPVDGEFWFLALAFNPLLLIEFFSNAHNDAWMMGFAVLSLSLIWTKKERNVKHIFFSILSLLFSISMKYVTVIVVPFWLFLVLDWETLKFLPKKFMSMIHTYFFDFISLSFFLPLLTARSQQFHPWYLLWSISFLPFIRIKEWKVGLLILSISSLFRYVPWLWNGAFEFTDAIQVQQRLITWVPFAAWWGWVIFRKGLRYVKK